MKAAIIRASTGVIENVIELADGAIYNPGTGFIKVFDETAQIGGTWDGFVIYPPETTAPPVPEQISKRQFIIAAWQAGIITEAEALDASNTVPSAIDAVFTSLSDEQETAARITWSNMTVIPRVDPLVEAVGSVLSMSEEELDQFFIAAGNIP